jgi:hypothetical protein
MVLSRRPFAAARAGTAPNGGSRLVSRPLAPTGATRTAVLGCVLSLLSSLLPPAATATDPPTDPAKGDDTIGIASHSPSTSITSSGPLTRIEISEDLNCAVSHRDDSLPEFFRRSRCASTS